MKKLMKHAKTLAITAAGMGMAGAASAADYTTEIGAARTEAEGNVSAATLAVIGVAILGFGVAAIVGWLRR